MTDEDRRKLCAWLRNQEQPTAAKAADEIERLAHERDMLVNALCRESERAQAALARSDAEPHEEIVKVAPREFVTDVKILGQAPDLAGVNITGLEAPQPRPIVRRLLDRLRFCEECLRAGVPDEYFGWAGDQPSLSELAQSDAKLVSDLEAKIDNLERRSAW